MKTRLLTIFVFVLGLAFVLAWTVAAQQPNDAEPPNEGGPYFPGAYSGETVQEDEVAEEPTSPQPERGQRPLPPTAAERQAIGEGEILGVGPLGLGGGPFEVSYFFDDMEAGLDNWTATGLWHIADAASNYPNAYNGAASWWYGQEATGNYDTGMANSGYIQTGPITIPSDAAAAWLRFWSWEYTEADWSNTYDTRKVYTSTNGTDWTQVWQSNTNNDTAQWYEALIDLSSETGKSIYLRFEFDTVDGSHNGYRGWYLDDISVGYDRIQLFPTTQTGYGLPGHTVGYPWWSRWVQNNTGVTTTFDITATGVWTPSFGVSIGPINPGQKRYFSGNVQIPAGASLGTYDDATLLFTSHVSPTLTNTQTVRTWAGWVHHVSHQIIDDGSGNSQGNGNGKIDPGERIEMVLTMKNDLDRTAYDVDVGLWDSSGLWWYDSWEPYGDIAAGGTANSFGRYEFYVPPTIQPGTVITFSLYTGARGGGWGETFTETVSNYLELAPNGTGMGLPGDTVTYTLVLTNWTGSDTSFDLSASDNSWPTNVIPNPTGVISNGTSIPVTVTVDIPETANQGDFDVATLHAAGLGPASAFSDTAVLTTTASCFVEGTSPTTMGDLDDTYEVSPSWIYVYVYSSDNDTLDATVWGYNTTTASWDMLAQQWGGGSGVLMDGPVPSVYSRVRVWLDDTENNDWIYYDYRFNICPPVPEVFLTPDAQQGLASPGSVVTYTQRVVNATEITTAINLTVTDNIWPTTLLSGTTPITKTDVLTYGADFYFSVRVEVPAGANSADADTATIRATSATSPTLSDTAQVTTTATSKGWYQAYHEDYPTTPGNDDEAYLDSVNSFEEWRLTDDRDGEWDTAVSAFYRDRVPYAWTRGRSNVYGIWVNEVEFGARDETGTVVISTTRVVDHNQATDNIYDYDATIAVDPVGGNIGLAWLRYDRASDTDPWRWNVYYAIYDENGNVVQAPTALTDNTDNTVQDYSPVIEAYRDGHFAVAWEHYVGTGWFSNSVYYAVLNHDGSLVKPPTELTPNVGDFNNFDPRLAQLLDGNMMVLWEGEINDPWSQEAVYAILDTGGNVVQGETALTNYASVTTGDPDARNLDGVALDAGDVVIAWTNDDIGQIEYTILDANYTAVISPTVLTNTLSTSNWDVSLTEDKDGRAVFTWRDGVWPYQHIYYALVDRSGNVVIKPSVYRQARNTWIDVNWKGYGNGGMKARPLIKIYLPLVMKNH